MPPKYGAKKNNSAKLHQLNKLQDKALHVIHFFSPQSPLDHIYHNENILELRDFISLQNTLLIQDYFDSELPCTFNTLMEHDVPHKIVFLSTK